MEWIREQWYLGNKVRVFIIILIALFVIYSVAEQIFDVYQWGKSWGDNSELAPEKEESTTSVAEQVSTDNTSKTDTSYSAMMTNFHNNIRKQCKVPNMKWDEQLAAYAQDYANQMASAGKLDHHLGTHHSYKDMNAGENLAMSGGLNGEDRIKQASINAINGWAEEGRKGPPPAPNHYTAMVWKDSKKVGCGVAEKDGRIYTACNYSDGPPNMNYPSTNKVQVPCSDPLSLQ